MALKSKNWKINERENCYFQPKERETTKERIGNTELQGFFLKWKLKQTNILEEIVPFEKMYLLIPIECFDFGYV